MLDTDNDLQKGARQIDVMACLSNKNVQKWSY